MLSRPQDFAALKEHGTGRSQAFLSARSRQTGLEVTRFGLATGRTLGSAVARNRARRRLREAIREMAPAIQPGWDVLIIARPAIATVGHEALVETLRRLLERSGITEGTAGR